MYPVAPIKKNANVFVVTIAYVKEKPHYSIQKFVFGGYREPSYKGGPDCTILRGKAKIHMPLYSKQVFRNLKAAETELSILKSKGN